VLSLQIKVANGKIGFGITVDYDNVRVIERNIKQTYLNGKPNFGYQLDTYSLMKCDI
jgi:hypothetical protein